MHICASRLELQLDGDINNNWWSIARNLFYPKFYLTASYSVMIVTCEHHRYRGIKEMRAAAAYLKRKRLPISVKLKMNFEHGI